MPCIIRKEPAQGFLVFLAGARQYEAGTGVPNNARSFPLGPTEQNRHTASKRLEYLRWHRRLETLAFLQAHYGHVAQTIVRLELLLRDPIHQLGKSVGAVRERSLHSLTSSTIPNEHITSMLARRFRCGNHKLERRGNVLGNAHSAEITKNQAFSHRAALARTGVSPIGDNGYDRRINTLSSQNGAKSVREHDNASGSFRQAHLAKPHKTYPKPLGTRTRGHHLLKGQIAILHHEGCFERLRARPSKPTGKNRTGAGHNHVKRIADPVPLGQNIGHSEHQETQAILNTTNRTCERTRHHSAAQHPHTINGLFCKRRHGIAVEEFPLGVMRPPGQHGHPVAPSNPLPRMVCRSKCARVMLGGIELGHQQNVQALVFHRRIIGRRASRQPFRFSIAAPQSRTHLPQKFSTKPLITIVKLLYKKNACSHRNSPKGIES